MTIKSTIFKNFIIFYCSLNTVVRHYDIYLIDFFLYLLCKCRKTASCIELLNTNISNP